MVPMVAYLIYSLTIASKSYLNLGILNSTYGSSSNPSCPLLLIVGKWVNDYLRILHIDSYLSNLPLTVQFKACEWSDFNQGTQSGANGCLSDLLSYILIHRK